MDVAALSRALAMLPLPRSGSYGDMLEMIGMFNHVAAVGDIEPDGYATDVAVVAGGPDVWPRLLEVLFAMRGRSS
jgi:hypothetical protein